MKDRILVSASILFLFVSCKNGGPDPNNNLNCVDYWAEVAFSDFCGLATGNFDFDSIPNDICNADQNSSYTFDDRVSVRVFNHFSNDLAQEEYDAEERDAKPVNGYRDISDLGDDAFGLITVQFGELDLAIIQAVKGTFTLYLEVNGNASNGANNCFDESSVIEFAKALVRPL